MISKLIERTNQTKFYQTGRIKLIKFEGQIGTNNAMEFDYLIDEQNNEGNSINIENWRITSHQTIDLKGVFASSYLPYIKINILDKHPLLSIYHENKLECELTGFHSNTNDFIVDLYLAFETHMGNWFPFNKSFINLRENFKMDDRTFFRIPEQLLIPVKNVCAYHNINLKVNRTVEGINKGYEHHPEATLLIFGNEDICPNTLNLGQPYIIANKFTAIRI
ncbi:hypothetical protein [Flagellimonas sp. 2504JD4-2]